ncbi:cytochrome P450 [Saliphagus sp. LR7]|uniref:cytochrome P450 n=1 Tax=Saliphagus sp. LR7 TaxID=2282654 RepID=UPI000DF79319|nr:cytochrome P450 [Saliphagus sp. LR7]
MRLNADYALDSQSNMVTETDATTDDAGSETTRAGREPPGPDGLPGVGNTFALARDVFGFYERLADEYEGDVARYRVAGDTAYLLTHPDHVEQVLVTDAPRFVKGEMQQRQIGSAFGEGMLLAEGDDWREQRTTAQPAFYRERIEAYAPVAVSHAEAMANEWDDGDTIEIHDAMTELTLSVLARALFGIDIRGRQSPVRAAATATRERFDTSRLGAYLPEWLPTPVNRRYKHSLAALQEFIEELVAERRTADKSGTDLLSLLVAATDGDGMDDETLRDNMATFLFAGHETTALTLTYTLFLLGHHPDTQERLHAELDEVLGDDSPTAAILPELDYTEQVVEEAMRLYPPVWTTFREPAVDTEVGGYTIPEGAVVSLPQWIVHRDERWYDAPLEFRPERWAGGGDDRPEYAHYPFGGGPRHCIGMRFARMEARLVVATLANEFTVESLTDAPLDLTASANALPAEPVELRLSRR